MRTFDVQSIYKNSAEIMRVEVTEDQEESGLSPAICCAKSADDEEDPLIEACDSEVTSSVKAFTFASDTCTSITTTTTVFRDALGNEKATRVETGESTSETNEACCEAAVDTSSDLLFACTPTVVDINEVYSYDDGVCSRTYHVQSTYKNSAGIIRV